MRLTVRLLGAEVFHVDTDGEGQQTGAGDATSMPVSAPATDQYMGFTNGREDEG